MEYKKERDKEFLQTCEKIRKAAGRYISVRETVKKAIRTPATSFFISEREFGKIIRDKRRHTPHSKAKAELYREIRRRYKKLKSNYPNAKTENLARQIAYQSAPGFYLTESSAKNLYYKLLKPKQHPNPLKPSKT
ncbi:MAG: hypothetical protein LBL57_04120 [Tannerella sp.]|jgi:hypothetical protein|nr:hypothetical protein [Tannerella sp.]